MNRSECSAQVEGVRSVFQSFPTQMEAQLFLSGSLTTTPDVSQVPEPKKSQRKKKKKESTKKSIKKAALANAQKRVAVASQSAFHTKRCQAYTDGACSSNGKKGAVAGYGIYFSDNNPLNSYGPVPGIQTNSRAELFAIRMALQVAPRDVFLDIYTDSAYAMQGVNVWMDKWRKNGWQTASGGLVAHRDLWLEIHEEMIHRKGNVAVHHVRGHAGLHGNECADALARRAVQEQEKEEAALWV